MYIHSTPGDYEMNYLNALSINYKITYIPDIQCL